MHKRRKRTQNEATPSTTLDAAKEFLEEVRTFEDGQFEDAEGQQVSSDHKTATEENNSPNNDVAKVEDQGPVKSSNGEISDKAAVGDVLKEEKTETPADDMQLLQPQAGKQLIMMLMS